MAKKRKVDEALSKTCKIGIISDTHGKCCSESLLPFFKGVDEIWHAGDVAGKDGGLKSASSVLAELQKIAPVTHVVRGNVDKFAGGLRGFPGFCEQPVSRDLSIKYPEVCIATKYESFSSVSKTWTVHRNKFAWKFLCWSYPHMRFPGR